MQITLYSGFSKENNSTKIPSGGTDVSCVLKEATSIINPVFILQAANFDTNYVKWNNRYYFVDDVVSIRNDAVELHCSVDAMASWKSEIGSSSQYVTRAASQYNGKLIDILYPTEADTVVSEVYLNALNNSGGTSIKSTGSFVVGVANGETASSGGVTYYTLSPSEFQDFISDMFGGNWLDAPLTELSLELQKELVNPFQYVVSAQYFPFTVGGTSRTIKFGYWDSGASGLVISNNDRNQLFSQSITIPRHAQAATRGAYLNGSPFTQIMLNCFMFGSVPIDPSYFVNSGTCAVSVNIDVFTGVGTLRVTDPSGYVIAERSAQCGVPIQISQVTQNILGASLSAVATGVSLAAGNPLGVASGVLSSIQQLMPQIETRGANGSSIAWAPIPTVIVTHRHITADDTTHLGRPLMQRKTISSLSGFIQVENPDVDIPATQHERSEIASYMQQGFFYE